MTPLLPESQPPDCVEFTTSLQRVLDREISIESASRLHAFDCANCRTLLAAVETLAAGLEKLPFKPVPAELAERIVTASVRDYRRRRAVRRTGVACAVAAALLVVVGTQVASRTETPAHEVAKTEPTHRSPEPVAPERVSDRFAEAGSALASMTRKASEQALTPTRTLVPSPDQVSFSPTDWPAEVEPAADSLAGMPEAAKSGLEPVTTGARRAVNLFLRDTGLARPKS